MRAGGMLLHVAAQRSPECERGTQECVRHTKIEQIMLSQVLG